MRAKGTNTDETYGNKQILGQGQPSKTPLVNTKAGVTSTKDKDRKTNKSTTTRSRTRGTKRKAESESEEDSDEDNSQKAESFEDVPMDDSSADGDNEQTMVYKKQDMSMANVGRKSGRLSRTAAK